MRRLILLAAILTGIAAPSADGSQLVDRDASAVSLAVNSHGEALLTYYAAGTAKKRVLAWGAVNAIAPTTSRAQVALRLDYSGGYSKYRRDYWKTFATACGSYDGPPLA